MRQEAYKKSHEMLVRLFSSPGFHHPAVLQGRRRLFADGHNPHISVRAELEILGGFIVRLAVRQIFFDLIKRNHICNGSCLIEEAAVLIQLIHTFVEEDDAVFQDRELGKRPVGEIKGARLGIKSCLCRWKQTDRYIYYADFSRNERHPYSMHG